MCFFFLMIRRPPRSTLFPYTPSSDLLFELRIPATSVMMPAVAGRPIYLGLAMTPANRLTLKPQNLLFNLPLLEN